VRASGSAMQIIIKITKTVTKTKISIPEFVFAEFYTIERSTKRGKY
jgi:rRNA-processing protein FCF1